MGETKRETTMSKLRRVTKKIVQRQSEKILCILEKIPKKYCLQHECNNCMKIQNALSDWICILVNIYELSGGKHEGCSKVKKLTLSVVR